MSDAQKSSFELTSAALHVIAMASMLLDHAMKTVVGWDSWLIVLGRIAFPIFAFMAAEGFFHTRSYCKYALRLLLFAALSEVPYDLMKSGSLFDPYDQNVIWTFLLALICMVIIDLARKRWNRWVYALIAILMTLLGLIAGFSLFVDYGGMGVLMVLVFYFFRERNWRCRLMQFLLLAVINVSILGPLNSVTPVTAFGLQLEIPLQGFALLALIPIWLYRGRQGYHSKPFQYACYLFYPVHMMVLVALSSF